MNYFHTKNSEPKLPLRPSYRKRVTHALKTNIDQFFRWSGVELNVVSQKEKLIAGLGGFVAIALLMLITGSVLDIPKASALIASMGASTVLLFAVPHGQLSQPWPVIAGHIVSALIGIACARWIPYQILAAACAVGMAIAAMHQLKCIHPPGGATALTAVISGQAVHKMGFYYAVFPVAINAVMIVAVAVLFNLAFKWRRYPIALGALGSPIAATDSDSRAPTHEEIVEAIRSLDSFIDISEADLVKLVQILAEKPSKYRFKKSA
ncbi:HPP family protein [Luteolibacter algae]|uniref:HPP family protein n=1 Tax=Luteolibacter algae TaxID=454151 RepID=A0ABW5DCF1_9BACT